jgi:hypothetical protein
LSSQEDVKASSFTCQLFQELFDNPSVNIDPLTTAILANRAADQIAGSLPLNPAIEDKLSFYKKIEEFTKKKEALLLLQSHKVIGTDGRPWG